MYLRKNVAIFEFILAFNHGIMPHNYVTSDVSNGSRVIVLASKYINQ